MPAHDAKQERDNLIATGYLALSRQFRLAQQREPPDGRDSIHDNIGKAFLGLSVSCASRCHDHKFDAIYSSDYYALYGILASTTYAFPGTEIYRHTKDFVPVSTDEDVKEFEEYQSELASLDDKIEELTVERAGQVQARMVASDTAANDPASPPSLRPSVEAAGRGERPGRGASGSNCSAFVRGWHSRSTCRDRAQLDQIRAEQLEAAEPPAAVGEPPAGDRDLRRHRGQAADASTARASQQPRR